MWLTLFCSTEQIFADLDKETQEKILPLKLISRKATEFVGGGVQMNEAGIRRLDDAEAKYALPPVQVSPTSRLLA